jgi:hypothetical protein
VPDPVSPVAPPSPIHSCHGHNPWCAPFGPS